MSPYRFHPTVFCVKDCYQIIFLTEKRGMGWVEVGGEKYADTQNGLMRWNDEMHRVSVPCEALDRAGGYAVCYQEMEDRAPYFPEHGPTARREYRFFPVREGEIRICYLSDTHGHVEEPVACAGRQEFDLLVMGGDIADHNSEKKDLWVLFDVCSRAAKGEKPVVFSRGNHDTRGRMAEYLPGMIGTDGGRTYFSFELPGVFGMALDAGEDKPDAHEAYGGTTCFELFRREQTKWLEQVYEEGRWKNAPLRIALCHIPFTMRQPEPFDIEQETYARWTELLNKMGVQYLISGHMHALHILRPGDDALLTAADFTTLVGSEDPSHFVGAHYTAAKEKLAALFVRADGEVVREEELARNGHEVL